jgi:hypothetical protein
VAALTTLVDTAAEQAREARGQAADLAHVTAKRASGATDRLIDLAETTVPIVAARARRREQPRRRRRRPPIVLLLVVGAVITTVVVVRRRMRPLDTGPAPDPFGAAVASEPAATGDGWAGAHPVPAPTA